MEPEQTQRCCNNASAIQVPPQEKPHWLRLWHIGAAARVYSAQTAVSSQLVSLECVCRGTIVGTVSGPGIISLAAVEIETLAGCLFVPVIGSVSFQQAICTTKLKKNIRGNTFIVEWDIMRVNGYVDRRGSGLVDTER